MPTGTKTFEVIQGFWNSYADAFDGSASEGYLPGGQEKDAATVVEGEKNRQEVLDRGRIWIPLGFEPRGGQRFSNSSSSPGCGLDVILNPSEPPIQTGITRGLEVRSEHSKATTTILRARPARILQDRGGDDYGRWRLSI